MNQFFRQTLGKENTKKDIFSLINQEKSSSREKVIGYLKEMGIETGFLTIKVGDVEKVYYYTTHEYSIPVKSKERYDEQYQGLTNTTYGPVSIFRDFPPNATIEGKECN